jgi:ABC-type bacteriocin/lantibiotic exporter with double-glycine peptidase domain
VYFLAIVALPPLVGAAIAGHPVPVPSASSGAGHSKAVRCPPQAVICGANALYMLLKAHGQPVSASPFFREVNPGDQGLSLVEVRDTSTRYGLPAEVRRCTYEQLVGGCRLPLIAFVQSSLETADCGTGHYVLVVDADSEGITLVDGTSGEQKLYLRDAFCRNWKGYVVVPVRGQPDWLLLLTISFVVWMLVGWFILRSNRSGIHMSRSAGLEVSTDACAT